jgi:hypothetical protein
MSRIRNVSMFLRSALIFLMVLASVDVLSFGQSQNVVTERYDNARTGTTMQALPGGTLASTWAKKGELPVQGNVYAQPLFVQNVSGLSVGTPRNMVFVATETNQIYGFDANSLAQVWTRDLGGTDMSTIGSSCDGISPPPEYIGIESTPVIDVASNRLYVSYRINPQKNGADTAQQMVVAIDIRTGQTVLGPTQINYPGFLSRWERQRASLLLLNGFVYIAFSSRCEDPGQPIFHGSIVAIDASTLTQASVLPVTDSAIDGGGIWQGSSGLAADATDIYAMTGNRRLGVGAQLGVPAQPDSTPNYADSILRVHPQMVQGTLQLSVADWFTPYRKLWLDAIDLDLGSAGPTLISGSRYLIGGGKEGLLYLVDTTNMGKLDSANAWTDTNLKAMPPTATQDQFPDNPTADKVVQKFQAGAEVYIPANPSYLAPEGAPVAVAQQFGSNNSSLIDLFNVGRDGSLYVTVETPPPAQADARTPGIWTDGMGGHPYAVPVTPPIANPGAFVAAAAQTATQLDAFVTGTNGAVYVTSVTGMGSWTDGHAPNPSPFMITPAGVAPSGACLATSYQTASQLDLFYVGNDGTVYVTSVQGTGNWTDGSGVRAFPAPITPPGYAIPGTCVAAAKQTPTQLDVFFVNRNNGAVYVTAVTGEGNWTSGVANNPPPLAITSTGLANPRAGIAAASQSPTQLDVFVPGLDGAIHVTSVVGTSKWTAPVPITPLNVTSPTSSLSTAQQTANQLDVFYVASSGAIMVTSVVGEGNWTDGVGQDPNPFATGRAFTASGAPLAAMNAFANQVQGQVQVFAIGNNGAPFMNFVAPYTDETTGIVKGAWVGPTSLSRAIWMWDWFNWSHIHGGPVFARFPDGTARLYLWPEKDHLKSFQWTGTSVDVKSKLLGVDQQGTALVDQDGMPGGMLGAVVDPASPHSGVLFASLSQDASTSGPGILRAFDALTLKQIWTNQGDSYSFSKFVPFTFANGRLYLPTCSNMVIVYGP